MDLTMGKHNAEQRFLALRKSGFKGPIDRNGYAVMSRTDNKGNPLPLFRGGSGKVKHK
jgi:hypothetical protein